MKLDSGVFFAVGMFFALTSSAAACDTYNVCQMVKSCAIGHDGWGPQEMIKTAVEKGTGHGHDVWQGLNDCHYTPPGVLYDCFNDCTSACSDEIYLRAATAALRGDCNHP
jgi:hypothetical protein